VQSPSHRDTVLPRVAWGFPLLRILGISLLGRDSQSSVEI
jgi:hypothetical protein